MCYIRQERELFGIVTSEDAKEMTLRGRCRVHVLGCTHNVQSLATVVNRHIPPLSRVILVGKQLRHELLGCHASLLEEALLSVLAIYRILGVQNTRTSYTDSFLPRANHVETQTTLPLGIEHGQVHDGNI